MGITGSAHCQSAMTVPVSIRTCACIHGCIDTWRTKSTTELLPICVHGGKTLAVIINLIIEEFGFLLQALIQFYIDWYTFF